MVRWLHHDLPALWRCDLQIAPHGDSFPPGLKTRRAQQLEIAVRVAEEAIYGLAMTQTPLSKQPASWKLDSDASGSATERPSRQHNLLRR